MIFDSLGMGELGMVLVLGILLIDPKRLGSVVKQVMHFRRKVAQFQNQVRSQLNSLVLEEDIRKEAAQGMGQSKEAVRLWAKGRIAEIPAMEGRDKSATLTQALLNWPVFQAAQSVTAFVGKYDEIDTEVLLQAVLDAGKNLYLPFVPSGSPELGFCRITDLKRDLEEGVLGILEPKPELRVRDGAATDVLAAARAADLTLVPGLSFDAFGGRLGRGKGYYDRHLSLSKTYAVGVAYEAQVYAKKLPLETHDRLLDALVTESRFLLFQDPPAPVMAP